MVCDSQTRHLICVLVVGTLSFVYVYMYMYTNNIKHDYSKHSIYNMHEENPLTIYEEKWIKVPNIDENVWIFSAYYLTEGIQPKTKLYGIRTWTKETELFCKFIDQNGVETGEIMPTQKLNVSKKHSRKYEMAAFLCNTPDGSTPEAVSLVGKGTSFATEFVRITYPSARRWEFSVCCDSPIFGRPKPERLIEMIELNRILGAEHIFFYNRKLTPAVERILRYYKNQGFVTVVQWDTPKDNGNRIYIPYHGQIIAINDCIQRNMHSSKFVFLTDIDEFVIPRLWDNWKDMINAFGDDYDVYMFSNVYFPIQLDSSVNFAGKKRAENLKAMSLLKLRKLSAVWSPGIRSKYCINPRANDVATVHYVWRLKNGSETYNVPPDKGVLHHYRDTTVYERLRRKEFMSEVTADKSVLRFQDRLLNRLNKTYSEIGFPNAW